MNISTKIFRAVDIVVNKLLSKRISKFIGRYHKTSRLIIIGGGPSKELVPSVNTLGETGTSIALLNYTKMTKPLNIDFLLLSDHYVFQFKNFRKTLRHIKSVNPATIILPTRALYSLLGCFALFDKRFVFIRYYGTPLWEMGEMEKQYSLFDIIPSYDTVAFEFGFPLAKSLAVDDVIFAGVDLSYGAEEDATPFRVQWRKNIQFSIDLAKDTYTFKAYKISHESFGPFEVFE